MSTLRKAYAIVPSDIADLPNPITKLYVGGAGSIKLEMQKDPDGTFVTLTAVPVGTVLEGLLIRKIWATGTGASLLVGFYGG